MFNMCQTYPGLNLRKSYSVFQKELYNCIPNVTLWRVLRKRLHVCTPVSVNVFITLATQQHLDYHCKVVMKRSSLPV
jgi:hypothetical protein